MTTIEPKEYTANDVLAKIIWLQVFLGSLRGELMVLEMHQGILRVDEERIAYLRTEVDEVECAINDWAMVLSPTAAGMPRFPSDDAVVT
ncbi:MAG TPA: hypothetical protein VLE72_00045 [Candidatus Saccharimonadales bacterium]|nr:hypothetical protein [Candidatus Saccharimonadales bacterium]